jgi:hypothetical protein
MKWRESAALIPFGKFKGTPISAVPNWYLSWLAKDCSLLSIPRNQAIKVEIETELATRVEATIPTRIKAYERQEEDRIYLAWWLDQGRTWYRIGFPYDLPSESDFWVPPYGMHFSHEWYAFQRRKADYRKRHLQRQIAATRKKRTCSEAMGG